MDPLNVSVEPILSEALVVWTGWGRTTRPVRDENLVVQEFGAEQAVVLLPRITQLEDEFYASDARFTAADLREMGEVAAAQFRSKHSEVSEEAVKALAWCYTFDYK